MTSFLAQLVLVLSLVASSCFGLSIQGRLNPMQNSQSLRSSSRAGTMATTSLRRTHHSGLQMPHHMVSLPVDNITIDVDESSPLVVEPLHDEDPAMVGNTPLQGASLQQLMKQQQPKNKSWRQRIFSPMRTTTTTTIQSKSKALTEDDDHDDSSSNNNNNKPLTVRQKIGKMGLSVGLSYGVMSNISTSITTSLAWYISSTKYHLSPLAPGQWKSFLAIYAGIYVVMNALRPVRVALAIGLSRYVDMVIQMVQNKFQVGRRVAIGITFFLVNIVGSCSLMAAGITLASLASGVPIFVR